MAKALALTPDALTAPQITPKAATPPRAAATPAKAEPVPETAKAEQVPLQLRIPREAARAIKVAAAERDQTLSDFMLACFHAYMQKDRS